MNRCLSLLLALTALFPLRPARAVDQIEVPAPARTFRVLVIPYDVGGIGVLDPLPPSHQPWMTTAYLDQAFFAANLSPMSGGVPLTSGSVADYWRRQVKNLTVTGSMINFPAGTTVQGWYQLDQTDTSFGTVRGEAMTHQSWSILLNRIGYGKIPNTNGGTLDPRPLKDCQLRNNVDALIFISGGGGGATRTVDDTPCATAGLGTDASLNYDWLGVMIHETGHLMAPVLGSGFMNDFYRLEWEDSTEWSLMSQGYGRYPAALSPASRQWTGVPRRRFVYGRGETAATTLFPHLIDGTTPNQIPEVMELPNDTSPSEDAFSDRLLVEYKQRSGSAGFDSGRGGFPAGNSDGLLIQGYDPAMSGMFPGFATAEGELPVAFGLAREDGDFYTLSSGMAFKRSGNSYAGQHTYGWGQPFARAADDTINWRGSSVNRDGNLLWAITDHLPSGTGARITPQWMGKSVALEMEQYGRVVSHTGVLQFNQLRTVHGRIHRVPYDASLGRREVLRCLGNEGSPSRVQISLNHHVAGNGEVMTFSLTKNDETVVTEADLVQINLEIRYEDVAVQTLSALLPVTAAPQPCVVDLSPWRGRCVQLVMEFVSGGQFDAALTEAWFFEKGQRVDTDLISAVQPTPDPISVIALPGAPAAVGVLPADRLEDGVIYGRMLALRPRFEARGIVETSVSFTVPPEGGILRGAVGYKDGSVGTSDGALLRMTLDDGVHRFGLRNNPNMDIRRGETLVAPMASSGAAVLPNQTWASGLGWTAPFYELWRGGDWVRCGDVNGDHRDDLILFTGGDRPRVAVALSDGTRFLKPVVWHTYFCLNGERPFVGDFNGDGRADIVTITPAGATYGAVSTGAQFSGTGWFWGSDIALSNESVSVGDMDGDGRDDLVVCTHYAEAGNPRAQGYCRVMRGLAGGGLAAPVVWGFGVSLFDEIPHIGDLNNDGCDDLVSVTDHGQAWRYLSSPAGFGSPAQLNITLPVQFADPFPILYGQQIYQGPRYTEGNQLVLGRTNAGPAFVWFARNYLPFPPPVGDVYMSMVNLAGASPPPVKLHDYFGINEEWPLFADFTGDGQSDLLVMQPSYANVYQLDHAREGAYEGRDEKYPGDLYISPKPARSFLNAPVADAGLQTKPRLNRFEFDLSGFAGRTLTLELRVDAGPNAAGDVIVFPELKLYGAAVTVNDPGAEPSMRWNTGSSFFLERNAETSERVLEYSTDLNHWAPFDRLPLLNGSGFDPVTAQERRWYLYPSTPARRREYFRWRR